MKKISIKTVDGNRYDFVRDESNWPFNTGNIHQDWIQIDEDGVKRLFFRQNIVSITIKDIDNGKN